MNTSVRTGEFAELVKCSPEEHEGPSLSPGIIVKILGVVTHAYNSNAEEVEAGRSLGLRHTVSLP